MAGETGEMAEQPATPVSASDLAQLNAELTTQFEAQLTTYTSTIQRQAEQIEDLKVDSMILRAKLDGRDAFYLFLRLPPEIRVMVWERALSRGRLVEIGFRSRTVLHALGIYS